ncbi:PilZ domain-containing protein [Maridesulfovibrio hydrothermalis]|uniref:Type IV pilus assembly PilZ n=1 Tax=Maridesulfovibrio hydrothermalis AM13 = DSM 14728 TaxID=1121451 RepID=L0R7Z9_9BACT|nr:PilZ domain-containing protein [Maridesulfovibrio hydrothermalis]CCO22357.1 Type IV pilus assembly PilZ [Maridesulfovibrio hydrothermalis AM13 = DSM 14728]
MDQNKRRRTRIKAGFTVVLHKGDIDAAAESLNLSLKGILCGPVPGFSVGDKCEVTISLSEEAEIRVEANVVRADDTGLAVDFSSMDEMSFTHLRRLIQFNADDADTIDSELTSPAFDV